MENIDSTKYYVLYDGDCGFCNFWVQWILARDTRDHFMFASLQSDFGQKFLKERGLETKNFNTLYLWKPQGFYLIKSKAVLEIAKILGGTYGMLARVNFLPAGVTDIIYDRIAANRQRLATESCLLPTPEQRRKFIS